MSVSEAQKKAVTKYTRENYDKILVTIPKGEREKIKDAAESVGMSMNAFIVDAIRAKMIK
jgi:uncharacterized protein (DUF1778 family)